MQLYCIAIAINVIIELNISYKVLIHICASRRGLVCSVSAY